MKRAFISACVALACTVALGAQPPQTGQAGKADPASSKDITVQGCLQKGEQPNSFVVTNVMKPDAKLGATGTAGTTEDAELTALKGSSLRLIGNPKGMSLTEHVGHTVEVTGALAPKEEKSKAGAETGAATGTKGAWDDMRKLNVKDMKHISTTCTAR